MPVNYTPPTPESLLPVPGIALGAAAGRIKNWDRNDVLLVVCEPGTAAAGVFTKNRFCAAPVNAPSPSPGWTHNRAQGER